MPLLWRSKSKARSVKESTPAVPASTEARPKPAIKKYVPRHGMYQSQPGDETRGRNQTSASRAYRPEQSLPNLDTVMNDASTHNPEEQSQLPGFALQQPSRSRSLSSTKPSATVYFTDHDAPPIPTVGRASGLVHQRASHCSTNDYFAARRYAGPASHPHAGSERSKLGADLVDDSFAQVTDSGYASAEHSTGGSSRAPSEHNPEEQPRQDAANAANPDRSAEVVTRAAMESPEAASRQSSVDQLTTHDSGVCLKLQSSTAADSTATDPAHSNVPRDSVSDNDEVYILPPTRSTPAPAAVSKTLGGDIPGPQPISRDFGAVEPARAITFDQGRRPMRPLSERNLRDFSRMSARPSMISVPENRVAQDVTRLTSKELFSYKGDLSSDEIAAQRLATRMRQMQVAGVSNSHLASLSNNRLPSMPAGYPHLNPKMAHVAGTVPPPAFKRRATMSGTSSGSPLARPPLPSWNSYNQPLRSSPLASHEVTPDGSIAGTESDEPRLSHAPSASAYPPPSPASAYPPSARSASFRTAHYSMTPLPPVRARSYFSHAGKIIVDSDGSESPVPLAASIASAPPSIRAVRRSVSASPASDPTNCTADTPATQRQQPTPSKKSGLFARRKTAQK